MTTPGCAGTTTAAGGATVVAAGGVLITTGRSSSPHATSARGARITSASRRIIYSSVKCFREANAGTAERSRSVRKATQLKGLPHMRRDGRRDGDGIARGVDREEDGAGMEVQPRLALGSIG